VNKKKINAKAKNNMYCSPDSILGRTRLKRVIEIKNTSALVIFAQVLE
jgi:hypothetical protein